MPIRRISRNLAIFLRESLSITISFRGRKAAELSLINGPERESSPFPLLPCNSPAELGVVINSLPHYNVHRFRYQNLYRNKILLLSELEIRLKRCFLSWIVGKIRYIITYTIVHLSCTQPRRRSFSITKYFKPLCKGEV